MNKLRCHRARGLPTRRLPEVVGFGERDKAADAYEHAVRLKPDDPTILVAEAEAFCVDLALAMVAESLPRASAGS
jgi:hypothetical protein